MEVGRAQGERKGQAIVALGVGRGKTWLERVAIGANADERVVDEEHGPDAHVIGGDDRIEALNIVVGEAHGEGATGNRCILGGGLAEEWGAERKRTTRGKSAGGQSAHANEMAARCAPLGPLPGGKIGVWLT